jgi:hypothetical protein
MRSSPKSHSGRGAAGDGVAAAVALLTATLPVPDVSRQAQEEALLAVIPTSCEDLVDLFAGVYAVAHLLLSHLSDVTGEPLAAPLQRLAAVHHTFFDDNR